MSSTNLPKKQELDWYDSEPIREEVFGIRRCRDSDDDRVSRVGEMLLPENGQVLDLRVKVTDPDLAQAVLISMYGEGPTLIPGMELQRIIIDTKTEARQSMANKLRELASRIESGEFDEPEPNILDQPA